jgi:hypothetical protein
VFAHSISRWFMTRFPLIPFAKQYKFGWLAQGRLAG